MINYQWILILLFIFNGINLCLAQNWIRIYGEDRTCWAAKMIESYDHGYIILSQVDPGPTVPQMYAWIIKTDINGNILWNKKIFNPSYYNAYNDIQHVSDGGWIMVGVTTKEDPLDYDVSFMKLNACGEKEWCKIFSTPGNSDYGLKIKEIPEGYLALVKYFKDWEQKRMWLFKLDEFGGVIWQKLYGYDDPNLINEECRGLMITNDENYLITGDGYYWNPQLQLWQRRPLMIKTDPDGNQIWQLIYGYPNGYRGAVAMNPTEVPGNFVYCSARHFRDSIPYGDSPSFIKLSLNGYEVYYEDLKQSTALGIANTLNFINDSQMICACSWSYSTTNIDSTGLIKTDTLGNILQTKLLLADVDNTLSSAVVTTDNKYLVTGGFSVNGADPSIYLFKLNFDLEYDSIYTTPLTYDSLCPYPIVSDTMDMDDCDVITAIKEPEEYEQEGILRAFPNPASERIFIEIPVYLIRKSSSSGLSSTTIYHQWKESQLEVFDLFGRLMFCEAIPRQEKTVEIDVSSWPGGMYVARMVFMNDVVGRVRFMVR